MVTEPLSTRALLPMRIIIHLLWWVAAAAAITTTISSRVLALGVYERACIGRDCASFLQMNAEQLRQLADFGIMPELYSSLTLVLLSLQTLSFWVVGFLLYRYGWRDLYCVVASILLIVTGTIFSVDEALFSSWPLLQHSFAWLNALGTLYLFFLLLFPEGRFIPRWTAAIGVVWLLHTVINVMLPDLASLHINPLPAAFNYVVISIAHLVAFGTLIYRYTCEKSRNRRRKLLWLLIGICGYVAAGILANTIPLADHGFVRMMLQTLVYASLLFIPFPLGVIILEDRARRMAVAFNRTMVYLVLSVVAVIAYALLLGAVGLLIQGRSSSIVALLATGLLAVLMQPLRERVQRGVNRLVYGFRDNPYQVLSQLSRQLASSTTHRSLLASVARKVASALQVSYAAIEVYTEDKTERLAVHGKPGGEISTIELQAGQLPVGRLLLGAADVHTAVPPGAQSMIEDLVQQVSIAVQTYRLADDLQHSRERLVQAREEERRRLRRDLHDGLGSSLASMTLRLDEAIHHHGSDPHRSRTELETVRSQLRHAITDIRRLVYSLRPPALDEFGLAFALQELVMQYQTPALQIALEGADRDLQLNAATEVAIYRIVQEGLTNVVKHAAASRCHIRLALQEQSLRIEIEDDGSGLPTEMTPGIGVRSIRERAEELSGTFALSSEPGQGTVIRVSLPAV
ncbi:sensor histidine kinase [Paenibacillus sp. 1P07SE]|uniref:sensor histidine kinase n=1 Tax=Paenibacillus sp. 1P07SE TaxID=3132209 RepID=UPI0039A70368